MGKKKRAFRPGNKGELKKDPDRPEGRQGEKQEEAKVETPAKQSERSGVA